MNAEITELSLPTWTINECLTSKRDPRTGWETEFENNYKLFAEKISEAIAKNVFDKLAITLSCPYSSLPNKNNTMHSEFSFEIVKSKEAKQLSELSPEAFNLSPFNEWLQKFSIENQKINEDDHTLSSMSFRNTEAQKGIDSKYFQERMAVIGRLVKGNLDTKFNLFTQNSENKSLKFHVTWFRKEDQFLIDSSSFRNNILKVEVWLENKDIILNQTTLSTTAKERQRIERTKRFRRNTTIASVVALIFAAGALKIFLT